MKRGSLKVHNNERGAALIFVILALVIVSILAMAIASLVRSNLSQTVSQEDNLKAYYLAMSGQELAYAALLQVDTSVGVDPNKNTLVKSYFITGDPAETITPLSDTLTLEGGSVDVTVRALDKDTERWVEITSTATLEGSSVTKKVTLQFLATNPIVQIKS